MDSAILYHMKMTKLAKKQEEELEGYKEILKDVSSILERARGRAYKAVDNIRVQAYWQMGERVVRGELQYKEKPGYGEKLLKRLAVDLDIAWRNIYNALQFYKTYPILQTVSAKLSWSHLVEPMRSGLHEFKPMRAEVRL